MIYVKWAVFTAIKLFMLLTVPLACVLVPLFTRAEGDAKPIYTWGGIYGTFDNPPEGDHGFITNRAPFVNVVTGWRGYINRAAWMWRNKLYGLNKILSVPYSDELKIEFVGNPDISDKDKIAGSYKAYAYRDGKLIGWEYYAVIPYSSKRNVRIRIGWKILTRKFEEYGFAQLVTTFNPVDGYGDD